MAENTGTMEGYINKCCFAQTNPRLYNRDLYDLLKKKAMKYFRNNGGIYQHVLFNKYPQNFTLTGPDDLIMDFESVYIIVKGLKNAFFMPLLWLSK